MGKYQQILFFAVFLALICACRQQPQDQIKTAPASAISDETGEKPVVYFGVISRYNPRIMFEEYQPIMDYLTRETPYKFELKLGKTYEDAVEYLHNGDVQVASLGAVTYLESHALYNAVPILRPLNRYGKPTYQSLVVVREESPFKKLSDLKGHTFAFASIHSTSGNLIPRYYLAQAGIHLKDLKKFENLKHHDSVAKAVLTGEFEAGAVKDIIAYKYLDKGLRILYASDPIPSVPLVVRKDFDPQLVAAIKNALLKIDPNNPEMKKELRRWNAEFQHGFVETSDKDYVGIRTLLNEIPQRCGGSCHPARIF